MLDAVLGSAIGGGAGLMSDMEARKERKRQEAESRPKRRRLAKLQEAIAGYQEARNAGQMTLAQLAFDMARDVRM